MKQTVFNITITIVVCILCIFQYLGYTSNKDAPNSSITEEHSKIDTIPSFHYKSPKDGLMEALDYYGVKYPKIVYAQAILETGHFKSDLCVNDNNLFGLYNSKKKKFYTFNHWSESVVAYINFVQYKYKPPNDYYDFLDKLGYAEDPLYISKVKQIEKHINI